MRPLSAISFDERYELAWMAVVEHLYTTEEPPRRYDLVNAGLDGIRDGLNAQLSSHGINNNTYEPAPHFLRYWSAHVGTHDDFADHLVETLALPQVLACLTPRQYEAIAALAAHGTQRAAAQSLGIKPATLSARIARARQRIADLWHEHETPVYTVRKGDAERCHAGHSRAEYGSPDGCRACKRTSGLARYYRHKVLDDDGRVVRAPRKSA